MTFLFGQKAQPAQQRNLEKAWDVKVLDRTGLILEIFGERGKHARIALGAAALPLNAAVEISLVVEVAEALGAKVLVQYATLGRPS